MLFEPFVTLTAKTVVLAEDNIDTDQIIPARFLTTTQRSGLGRHAFHDWRYHDNGELRNDNPLQSAGQDGHHILVAGSNFGCGSSREHAPWALHDLGFRAVISSDIADIFTSNALKNGLLAIAVDADTHRWLLDHPGAELTIDLEAQQIALDGDRRCDFAIDEFALTCLLGGVDPLGFLLQHQGAIARYEEASA